MSESPENHRIRLTFSKKDSLRFIGHLDLAKTWERVLRRAQIPLVYSKGFNPQPKIQLASALPLGISSECELLDIWVEERVAVDMLPSRLNDVSPPGLVTHAAIEIPLKSPALQTVITGAEYLINVNEVANSELRRRVQALLNQEKIERERKGKTYDLRPLIIGLVAEKQNTIRAHLQLGQGGTARPHDVLDAMGLSFNRATCHRVKLHLQDLDS